jgi:hypothetical protein
VLPPFLPAGLIFVVDSADRDRLGKAAQEFQAITQDPLMLHRWVLSGLVLQGGYSVAGARNMAGDTAWMAANLGHRRAGVDSEWVQHGIPQPEAAHEMLCMACNTTADGAAATRQSCVQAGIVHGAGATVCDKGGAGPASRGALLGTWAQGNRLHLQSRTLMSVATTFCTPWECAWLGSSPMCIEASRQSRFKRWHSLAQPPPSTASPTAGRSHHDGSSTWVVCWLTAQVKVCLRVWTG